MADNEKLVRALLDRYPESFSDELGLDLSTNEPQPLFQWLVASLLLASRISHKLALAAAAEIYERGWTDARALCEAGWDGRVDALSSADFKRYDESTARYLGETCDLLISRYDGDLRKLRAECDGDVTTLRDTITDFTGIGAVGTDIFFRGVQIAWDELYPFVDDKAAEAAGSIGLPKSPGGLSALVSREDLPRLLSALIRMDLDGTSEEILQAASSSSASASSGASSD